MSLGMSLLVLQLLLQVASANACRPARDPVKEVAA
jgi:hypothetical protein